MADQNEVDVVVVGLGVGGEEVAGRLAEAGPVRGRHRAPARRRRVPVLGVRAEQDDDPGGEPAHRGAPDRRDGRYRDGRARLDAGREADPRGGHRRLGRHGRGGPVHRQGRALRARVRAARRARPGRGGRPGLHGHAGASSSRSGTAPAVPPIEGLAGTPYWTNREAIEATEVPDSLVVLGGGPIGVELGPGLRAVRQPGHRGRGAGPAARDRGARVERPGARRVRQGGHRRAYRREGRARRPRRRPVHGRPGRRRHHLGDRCSWSPPGAGPTCPTSGWTRSAWTRRRKALDGRRPAARVRSWTDLGGRRRHRATARSPTSRCTRPTSWSATSSARVDRPRTTGRCPGSRSPTRRSARSGSPRRRPASAGIDVRTGLRQGTRVRAGLDPQGGQCRLHQARRSTPTPGYWSGRRPRVRSAARCSAR